MEPSNLSHSTDSAKPGTNDIAAPTNSRTVCFRLVQMEFRDVSRIEVHDLSATSIVIKNPCAVAEFGHCSPESLHRLKNLRLLVVRDARERRNRVRLGNRFAAALSLPHVLHCGSSTNPAILKKS